VDLTQVDVNVPLHMAIDLTREDDVQAQTITIVSQLSAMVVNQIERYLY
jgi:hypothetical protein